MIIPTVNRLATAWPNDATQHDLHTLETCRLDADAETRAIHNVAFHKEISVMTTDKNERDAKREKKKEENDSQNVTLNYAFVFR